MCDFLARYPAVTGELTLADRVVNLVDEGVDVAAPRISLRSRAATPHRRG